MTDPKVKVIVPPDLFPSIVSGPSGAPYNVETAPNGERFLMASEADARIMINGGLADQRWKQANPTLSAVLGRPPKPEAGVNIAQLHMAQWQATRPLSIVEELAAMRAAVLGGWR